MNEAKEPMAATRKIHYRLLCSLALLPLFLGGCSSFGPKRVASDRFDYNAAIARSANEQMLLNLVRLRYREVPVFLALSSVLTQYTYLGQVGVGGSSGRATGVLGRWRRWRRLRRASHDHLQPNDRSRIRQVSARTHPCCPHLLSRTIRVACGRTASDDSRTHQSG